MGQRLDAGQARGLVGGLGLCDCYAHPWLRCSYDPCAVNALSNGTYCEMCVNDSTASEDCSEPDTDYLACAMGSIYDCPGTLRTGSCCDQICSAQTLSIDCNRSMGQCSN